MFVCRQVYNFFSFQTGKKTEHFVVMVCFCFMHQKALKVHSAFFMWLRPQRENFLMRISVENKLSVATKVSFAQGGYLIEVFLNLNDSEMLIFLLATYANGLSCFSFPVLFKASYGLWKWLIVTKGGIKFDLSVADLVLVSLFFVFFSLQFSGNGTIS